MKFAFVTYRWDGDIVGGAELHHRRLARELVDLGHEVSVYTTTGLEMRSFCHWGVLWDNLAKPGVIENDGIRVHRFPFKVRHKALQALDAKRLQAGMEREEDSIGDADFAHIIENAGFGSGIVPLSGWHHPEPNGGDYQRWTSGRARLAVKQIGKAAACLRVSFYAPKSCRVSLFQGSTSFGEHSVQPGTHKLVFDVSDIGTDAIIELTTRPVWRPLRDFRALALLVQSVELCDSAGGPSLVVANLAEDYRTLGRRCPRQWQDFLARRAQRRPVKYSRMIDRLRGPQSFALERAVAKLTNTIVIRCNLPWATISSLRPGELAMPLWHIEDDFYYWQHWISALRRARFVLANTPYATEDFYPHLGIRAHFVGPPIWAPEGAVDAGRIAAFRGEQGILPDTILVLTVCRKSPEKRYEEIAASVARLRRRGVPVAMIGIGPDADRRPFEYDGCRWLGKMTAEELELAFSACDVFCLMSESESFGMVIPEAWHHGRPVIVNRLCGPAASLVVDGGDGLLARAGDELDEALRRLADSTELRRRLGETGQAKARCLYTRGSAARRLLAALEVEQG